MSTKLLLKLSPWLAATLLVLSSVSPASAITLGELDNFSSTLESWQQGHDPEGAAGVTRPTTGGPAGAGDAFMQIVSDASSSHGKMNVFNSSAAWMGDYITAGVTRIAMSVKNLGAIDLKLRVALGTATQASSGTWFSSTNSVNLPVGSGWTNVTFPIDSSSLTLVVGNGAYNTALATIAELRLIHSSFPSSRGAIVTASLGVDNIHALGVPLVGDFDANGAVNAADLALWKTSFGATAAADADHDNDSDGADFLLWQRNVGQTSADSVAVAIPEPAASVLALAWLIVVREALRSRSS
jgi:hypothetical protein